MSIMSNDKAGCPFCEIVQRGGHAYEYVGDYIITFVPLNPVTPGHRLFVPIWHVEHPNPYLAGRAAETAVDYAGRHGIRSYNLITSAGAAATQTVDHIHTHLVPRREGDGLHLPWTGQVKS